MSTVKDSVQGELHLYAQRVRELEEKLQQIEAENQSLKSRLDPDSKITVKDSSTVFAEILDRYSKVFDEIQFGISLCDGDGKMVVNKSLAAMLGYSPEEMKDMSFLDITHPEDRDLSTQHFNRILERETDKFTINKRYIRKDGTIQISNTKVMAVFSEENDELLYTIATVEDISERAYAEMALKKAGVGLTEYSGISVFEGLAKSLAEITEADFAMIAEVSCEGKTVETLALIADGEPIPNISYSSDIAPCGIVIDTGSVVVQEHVQRDFPEDSFCIENDIVSYAGVQLKNSQGEVNGIIAVMHRKRLDHEDRINTIFSIFSDRASAEIERLRSVDALQRSEKRYRELYDNAPVSFWEFDATELIHWIQLKMKDGKDALKEQLSAATVKTDILDKLKILDFNHATIDLFEADSKEHLLENYYQIHNRASVNGLKRLVLSLAKNVRLAAGENSYSTIKGNSIHVRANWVVNRTPENGYRLVLSLMDITSRKEAEQVLENLASGSGDEGSEEFYNKLVRSVRDFTHADYVCVGKLIEDASAIELIAFYGEGQYLPARCCFTKRTPFVKCIDSGNPTTLGDVKKTYPDFELLSEFPILSLHAVPLKDKQNNVIGILGVMSKKPGFGFERHGNIIEVFASRAAVEMQRQIADDALRLSEESYRTIFNTAPASVVEYDMSNVWKWLDALLEEQKDNAIEYLRENPEVVFEGLLQFVPIRINDETLHIAKAKSKQHMLDNYSKLFRKGFFETGIKTFEAIISGKNKGQLTISFADLEKTPLELLVHWAVYGGASGKQYLLAACVDITEQRKAQRALLNSEQRYRSIFESTPVAFCEFDYSDGCEWFAERRKEGVTSLKKYMKENPDQLIVILEKLKLIAVNNETIRLTGVDDQAELNSQLWLVVQHESLPVYIEALEAFYSGNETFEAETILRRLNGETFFALLRMKIFQSDEVGNRLLVSAIDITERKKSEQKLRDSERELRRIFESSPIGLMRHDMRKVKEICSTLREEGVKDIKQHFVKNPDLLIHIMNNMPLLDLNSEAVRLLEIDENSNYKEKLVDYFIPGSEEVFRDSVAAYYYGIRTFRFEGKARTANNVEKHIIIQWTLFDEGENESFIVTGLVDITDRKIAEEKRQEMEEHLQHVQKLESLGVMASGIAHDFNNLLTGIMGNAELLQMDFPEESMEHQYASEIVEISAKAGELCNQMLAYSGRGSYSIEALNINDTIRDMYPLLNVVLAKKASLILDLAEDAPVINADKNQIRQVLLNLVSNAGEAIAEGSGKKVTVKTEQAFCDGVCKHSLFLTPGFKPGNYMKISVTDQGCGIFPDTLKLIFDPFFSTRFIGRGLGLPTVLGIVRSHNGGVAVESTPEVGSTFHVMLPLPEGKPIATMPVERHDADWAGGGTILVVDDEAIVRNLFSRILRRNGFEVVTASSGEQAIELFRDRIQLFSLLILDMTMPGIDGLETFQRMKALRPDINAIICSGYSEVRLSENPKTKGISAFIKKPFNIDDVTNTLKRVLSK